MSGDTFAVCGKFLEIEEMCSFLETSKKAQTFAKYILRELTQKEPTYDLDIRVYERIVKTPYPYRKICTWKPTPFTYGWMLHVVPPSPDLRLLRERKVPNLLSLTIRIERIKDHLGILLHAPKLKALTFLGRWSRRHREHSHIVSLYLIPVLQQLKYLKELHFKNTNLPDNTLDELAHSLPDCECIEVENHVDCDRHYECSPLRKYPDFFSDLV